MSAFLTVAVIHLLAVMSPGPDFAIITKNSLVYSRRSGIMTAIGLGLGMLTHTGYVLLGLGLVISKSILLFSIIKYIGAAYLLYIGFKALTTKASDAQEVSSASRPDLTLLQALMNGYLCNVLNPKATLFVLALFTQVIDPATPPMIQALYGIYMGVATFLWFAFLASVFSLGRIKQFFSRIQLTVERVMGALLIALGLKVALSSSK